MVSRDRVVPSFCCQVRAALRQRLGEVPWMSEASRVEALKKMEGFKVKIGYPDKFIDYGPLTVVGDKGGACYLRNVFAGRAFALALDLTRMNAPTDRGRCPSPSLLRPPPPRRCRPHNSLLFIFPSFPSDRWYMTCQTVNAYYHPSLNEVVFPAAILQGTLYIPPPTPLPDTSHSLSTPMAD